MFPFQKFSVGSGLSDKQRRDPPKVGVIVTYRFQELTRDGVPRFVPTILLAFDHTTLTTDGLGSLRLLEYVSIRISRATQ